MKKLQHVIQILSSPRLPPVKCGSGERVLGRELDVN
ncbi:predicted protein [Sclerotinia sclerotiorum 1980 UF-70]|uniref:Uncharacterized protein n=1 Tax=Sclerotinia sclerotiorum (strain ATCC 18683 / 1980 / Ss-1) TaxID=665079 RepID=A7EUZ0_SCLS1|nr:predicted protein [Sclerotinia sclerotiorum 1980 UF-70]EDN93282.1 predicted protein [Sclerotinia sclerotiorum 1980 UF-70]